jgi:hypothetical protein
MATAILDRVQELINTWIPCTVCGTSGNCHNCGGSGTIGRNRCGTCNGSGNCLNCGGSGQLNE